MQLILACKDQRDDGQIWYKNVAHLSQSCSLDARTARKILNLLHGQSINVTNMLIEYVENDDGTLVVTIPNYHEWQELDAKEVQQKRRKNVTKMHPTRPEQTKADQTKADQIEKSPRSNCPIQKIQELFNRICTSLPQIDDIEESRLVTLRGRWKKHPDLEWWEKFFVTVQASDWLTGRDPDCRTSNWCSFDWIIKPKNMTKIAEGNYVNKQRQATLLGPEAMATARNAVVAGEMIRKEEEERLKNAT